MESLFVALLVYLIGAVISFLVAALIKAVYFGIKLNESMKTKNNVNLKGVSLTSKPAGH